MRVILANESYERLERIAPLVRLAGHEVVAREVDARRVLRRITAHRAELAAVAADGDSGHALRLVEEIAGSDTCPVVLWTDDDDPVLARAALDRGAHACASRPTAGALSSAIDFAVRRASELAWLRRQVVDLEAGAQRRALVEQAKGLLMARHEIGEREAYAIIRGAARSQRVSVAEVAESLLRLHHRIRGPST